MIQLSSPEDTQPEEEETEIPQSDEAREELVAEIEKELGNALIAVSYTHLTLPTTVIV